MSKRLASVPFLWTSFQRQRTVPKARARVPGSRPVHKGPGKRCFSWTGTSRSASQALSLDQGRLALITLHDFKCCGKVASRPFTTTTQDVLVRGH
ncbi:hypothetical protein Y1Q_0001323 [Alligator mississippiensis]|uniref:Uncharacterized protein n=1 Tax=Alligator mississippiensis TaxID=8496 RepID=A0A151M914_ALLMI|nr:hypothetical protein Y1Q_0001323 [Alligator mississippiensis]